MTGSCAVGDGLWDPFPPLHPGVRILPGCSQLQEEDGREQILGTRGQLAPFLWGLVKGSVKAGL